MATWNTVKKDTKATASSDCLDSNPGFGTNYLYDLVLQLSCIKTWIIPVFIRVAEMIKKVTK